MKIIKFYLIFIFLIINCSTVNFSRKWPKEILGYIAKEEIRQGHDRIYIYEKENEVIKINQYHFSDKLEALGFFFNLRAREEKTFAFTNEKIRIGFINRNLKNAALWHNEETYFLETSNKLSREFWQDFLNQLTKSWPVGMSRPMVFQIFFSDKTQIEKLTYKPPFFVSPYFFNEKVTGELRIHFLNSPIEATNTILKLSHQDGFFIENLSNFTVAIGPNEISTNHENSVITLYAPEKSLPLKQEFQKILSSLPQ